MSARQPRSGPTDRSRSRPEVSQAQSQDDHCGAPTTIITVRRVLGVRFGPPMPRWMLELGAIGIRTETELVLKSRWVLPEKLTEAGFAFAYPTLEPALREALLPAS